ncbi:hypothetical protein [Actinoplanes sp. NPDC051851]|uniref:hypothetical protein n=1 Tax=Actinoplanes sp. NPDC051851 TaxID=3154753 RepID=UPI00341FBB88
MTKKLPVVDVDQAFPLLTTAPGGGPPSSPGDQTPAVAAAIRDVLGWRPRPQDTKAFTAALDASFRLSTVEGHVEASYVPRGYAIQADLGGVTGGQASLYTRAQAGHEQITRILDALKPLRPDSDPEDCEAYRALIRDSVRRLVMELGTPGGPRVELVDAEFGVLSGYRPGGDTGHSATFDTVVPSARARAAFRKTRSGAAPTEVALVQPGTAADDVPGQLGALRDRFGLTDDNVNTVDEEKIRTSFVTLVDLVMDLQRSWNEQRAAFGKDVGRGFLGTELVLINRLLAAAAEQVEEVEAVLDSALVSAAERQTVILNADTRLTLDGLLSWLRVFLTEDGPRIAQDTGRDGLTTAFAPTLAQILQTVRQTLVGRLVPCGSPSCGGAGACRCGRASAVSYLPLGCCTPLPPGMYAARTRIAVSGLCGLLQRLGTAVARIGRFSGAVLLDVTISQISDLSGTVPPYTVEENQNFFRVEVRGLHLRPSYIPAFVVQARGGRRLEDLVLPLAGSATATGDSVSAIFDGTDRDRLFQDTGGLRFPAVFAAAEVPIALVDGETGRVVSAPPVLTWPALRPAVDASLDDGPSTWTDVRSDQRFAGQPSSREPFVPHDGEDACEEPCADDAEPPSDAELEACLEELGREMKRVKGELKRRQDKGSDKKRRG